MGVKSTVIIKIKFPFKSLGVEVNQIGYSNVMTTVNNNLS